MYPFKFKYPIVTGFVSFAALCACVHAGSLTNVPTAPDIAIILPPSIVVNDLDVDGDGICDREQTGVIDGRSVAQKEFIAPRVRKVVVDIGQPKNSMRNGHVQVSCTARPEAVRFWMDPDRRIPATPEKLREDVLLGVRVRPLVFYIEGLVASNAVDDTEITADFISAGTGIGSLGKAFERFTIYQADLDSDVMEAGPNWRQASGDTYDGQEAAFASNRRIAHVRSVGNTVDLNGDGRPTIADFVETQQMQSLYLTLKAPFRRDSATVTFHYEGSVPRFVDASVKPGDIAMNTEFNPAVFSLVGCDGTTAGTEGFRLWRKRAGAWRSNNDILDGGDFIPPGTEIPYRLLSDGTGEVELLLEHVHNATLAQPGACKDVKLVVREGDAVADDTCTFKVVPSSNLIPDFNRDGSINVDDMNEAKGYPFFWWVNDDDDNGTKVLDVLGLFASREYGDSATDLPGSGKNYENSEVDGLCDLLDFFPLKVDIKPLLEEYPLAEGYSYMLRHSDSAVKFVYTSLAATPEESHIRNMFKARFGDNFTDDSGYGATHLVPPEGIALSPQFLERIAEGEDGVLLVEGTKVSNEWLSLCVERDGVEFARIRTQLNFCPVEQMYRHLNVSSDVVTDYEGNKLPPLPDAPETNMADPGPEALPDAIMGKRYFVFVHGYDNNGLQIRAGNSEIFRRLYAMGSNARYVAVSWNGDTDLNYQKAVFWAFQTGDELGLRLKAFTKDAPVTIAAHSLGNCVVSHAIQIGSFTPDIYCLIDAAVAMEAYAPLGSDFRTDNMIESSWIGRKSECFASNWYQCFMDTGTYAYLDSSGVLTTSKVFDNRREFRWVNRFSSVPNAARCVNYYSSGEDVLANRVDLRSSSAIWSLIPLSVRNVSLSLFRGEAAWKMQEYSKGLTRFETVAQFALDREQAGWGVRHGSSYDESMTSEKLRIDPPFRPFCEEDLFGQNFGIGSTVAAEKSVLYDVLAYGIPALSFAAGSNKIPQVMENINMQDDCKLGQDWPDAGHGGFGFSGRWLHSDFKCVNIVFVNPMYKSLIEKGNLK